MANSNILISGITEGELRRLVHEFLIKELAKMTDEQKNNLFEWGRDASS